MSKTLIELDATLQAAQTALKESMQDCEKGASFSKSIIEQNKKNIVELDREIIKLYQTEKSANRKQLLIKLLLWTHELLKDPTQEKMNAYLRVADEMSGKIDNKRIYLLILLIALTAFAGSVATCVIVSLAFLPLVFMPVALAGVALIFLSSGNFANEYSDVSKQMHAVAETTDYDAYQKAASFSSTVQAFFGAHRIVSLKAENLENTTTGLAF